MDYHGRMMNIPYDRLQETFDKNDLTLTARRPYKFGHRDARHAAAEIATEADREIDRLRTENEQLRTDLEEAINAINHSPESGDEITLKPCPFCGSDVADFREHPEHCFLYRLWKQNQNTTNYCIEEMHRSWNTRTPSSPPNFTVDDVLSVKTALTKIGHATPESNDLSPREVLSMFRRLANQVRAGLYEWMPDQREQEEL